MNFQENVINWLLEDENMPVRYLTLTKLLKKPESPEDVQSAKMRLMEYPVTQGILKHSEEFLKNDDRAYWKYTGKYWQLIFLGQFLADGNDPRISKCVESIMNSRKWIIKSGAQCLTANLCAALMRLGYGNHPVVTEEIEALANRIVNDGGIDCQAMLYSLISKCHMAIPKLLLCFAEIPSGKRSAAVISAIEILRGILLDNEVYIYVPSTRKEWQKILEKAPKRKDLPEGQTVKNWIENRKDVFIKTHGYGERTPKQGWYKFGFPLHYNSDILEAMYALAINNTPMTPNLIKPLKVIRDKMTSNGTWIMENSLNGKMWMDVEEKGKPGKWITFFALYVLNHFNT
ncbi:hypothetical protein ACFL6P_04870 [Candidatus Latescibacterota bacterium]